MRIIITDVHHPHHGQKGEALEYGPYGLKFMNLRGWRCRLDNGVECYAKTEQLRQD